MSPRERAIIAQFCRIQDQFLELHSLEEAPVPEPWRKAYEDLRALVGEGEIAAAKPWAIAIGTPAIEEAIRTHEDGDAIRRTIEELKRDYEDGSDD